MERTIPEDCLLGCHLSTSGGVDRAAERGHELGCTTGQVFTSNNRRWAVPEVEPDEAKRFREDAGTYPGRIHAHAKYLINLAKDDQEAWEKSVNTLGQELRRADRLDIPTLVLHPGSHVGNGEEFGLSRIAEGLDAVHDRNPEIDTRILLETMAGQGTGLGYRLEQLVQMRETTRDPDRLGYCVDTCHMHAGGYDLGSESAYESAMEEVESVLGLEDVQLLHLNDSQAEFDSRVDRHEHIGEGTIGEAAFRCLMNDPRWESTPKVLETPVEDDWKEDYGRNLDRLLSFREK